MSHFLLAVVVLLLSVSRCCSVFLLFCSLLTLFFLLFCCRVVLLCFLMLCCSIFLFFYCSAVVNEVLSTEVPCRLLAVSYSSAVNVLFIVREVLILLMSY